MKKIGIVTIIDYYNLGNRLQNYAVSYLLNHKFGCQAVTLEGYADSRIQGNFFAWLKEQAALKLCVVPFFADNFIKPKAVRWYRFSKWSKKWIPRKRFYNCSQLPDRLSNKFDFFITGSDQVWNCRIHNLRLNDFLLSFTEDRKKISLSASFGTERIPEEMKKYYEASLSAFTHISVREETGAEIVRELTGRSVPILIDPVMMLTQDEWIKVSEKPDIDISKPFVLKYFLGVNDKSIDEWAEKNGFIVYELMDKKDRKLYSMGPGEFISLIRNAALVCTDSFHCLAVSIIFCRPFIAFERQGSDNYMRSRIDTLLKKLDLQDRWKDALESENYLNCNFYSAGIRLSKEQAAFENYVNEVLKE